MERLNWACHDARSVCLLTHRLGRLQPRVNQYIYGYILWESATYQIGSFRRRMQPANCRNSACKSHVKRAQREAGSRNQQQGSTHTS